METTLIILKPDTVQRGLMGRIICRFEDKGLQVVGVRFVHLGQDLAERLYEPHLGKPFYKGLIKFMTSSPVLVMAMQGLGAIDICRSLMGATFGSKADPGTIRGDFGVSNSFNLVHGSDSPESAAREIPIFFSDAELFPWERASQGWVYDLSSGSPE